MRRALVAVVLGLLAGALTPGASAAAAGSATAGESTTAGRSALAGGSAVSASATAGRSATAGGPRIALVGVPGLMWSDVTPADTPNLWRLAGGSALGSLSVRTVGNVTCPYDGWLTVSSGVRSAVGGRCGMPPVPDRSGEGAVVPEFSWLWEVRGQDGAGTLGQALHDARRTTMAVGPGAALALADRHGRVDVYAASPAEVTDWSRADVLAVDIPDLITPYVQGDRIAAVPEPLSPQARLAAVRAADARLGEVLPRLGTAPVLLAGLGDHASVPHLRAAMLRDPGAADGGRARWLGGRSTHRDDMVILPDLTATILARAAVPVPAAVVGVPAETAPAGGDLAGRVETLRVGDVAGQTIRNMTGVFFTSLAVLQVLFYAGAFLLLRRREGLRAVRVAAIALAAIPVSTYLVNLTPWARAPQPTLTLVAGIGLTAAALTVVALAGPWRRGVVGPVAVIAAVTAAVLLGDLLTGTPLQLNSVMGYTGVVGARYYGLGNIPFALLATAVLLVTTVVADRLVRSGRKVLGVALVAALGGFAMLLDGWPGVGSDFGGVIAFVPGIAVAALLVAGKRVSVIRLAAFCVAGGVVVMGIAFLDYLRPPDSQTHLGRFVGQVLDGTFLPVISRKLGAMLHTLISPNLMPVVIAAFAFLVFALLRPGQASAGALPVAFERAPTLKAGLLGALVSGVVGMLVNDSGAAVLSMALALAVPLVLSAGIRALQLGDPVPATAGAPAGRTG
ncbi:hypothetical protein [Microbispora sp. ATCC PTA-5024]|uniref:hypothetical protein n=1 Tax=Microbispora sp. ATCC PTA-5024 TaxID=316330 RepID=UPI0003DB995B|nr:hypothetical protein [Microbispora sp. ATCC PTA-5024]ETK30435.1 hypothetical protein MPTA5024_40145 [Microbispora sp. ATCC PTA-5024]